MSRIYKVEGPSPDKAYLVRAATPAQAIRHVVRSHYCATVAAQEDLVTLLGRGIAVETAGDEPQDDAA